MTKEYKMCPFGNIECPFYYCTKCLSDKENAAKKCIEDPFWTIRTGLTKEDVRRGM